MRNASAFLLYALTGFLGGCVAANKDYCAASELCDEFGGDLGSGADGSHQKADLGTDGRPEDLGFGRDGGQDVSINPEVAGPYRTVQFDLPVQVRGGTTQTTIIGPSDDGKSLTSRGAPFALVVFSPGFTLDRKAYANYGQRLGSYGLITVLQKVPSELDHARYRDNTVELLDWLIRPSGMYADRVKGRIDQTRIGLAGHSLGGKIGILVAAADRRVKAYLGIDPVDARMPSAMDEVSKLKFASGVPVGFLGETISKGGAVPCTPAEGNYEALYGKARAPAFAITLTGASHNDFLDTCTGLCALACPGSMAPAGRTNNLAVKYVTAYFLAALTGNPDAQLYLSGPPFQKDVTAGVASRVAK